MGLLRKKADAESDKHAPSGTRTPLLITILVVAVVGGMYYAYYRGQVAYYNGRNLRLLSMLTAQVDGRVGMYADFVRTRAGYTTADRELKKLYSPAGIQFGSCSLLQAPKAVPRGTDDVLRGLDETSRGWKLELQTAPPAATPAAGVPAERTCATISLDDLLRPIFGRSVGSAFDMLLVAKSSDGTVVYSMRPPPKSSSLLGDANEWIDEEEEPQPTNEEGCEPPKTAAATDSASAAATTTYAPSTSTAPAPSPAVEELRATTGAIADRETGSSVLFTRLDTLLQRKGWRQYEKLDFKTLGEATDRIEVSLGGTDYVLFTQPYTFARPPVSVDGQRSQWIVCGLVSASRFRYDVSAVSTSIILTGIAIALLALCCWPFLRIALIHPSQALTITDVVLVVICTIVGAGVITLGVLDVFAYRSISSDADKQLEDFGDRLNADFAANVVRAMDVLSAAEGLTAKQAAAAFESKQRRTQPLSHELVCDEIVGQYPYIDSIAWVADDGWQQVRFARDYSPPTYVGKRQYFNLAREERTWTVKIGDTNVERPYVLEWVRSKATGEVRAVLAKKTENNENLPVISLGTELIDVSDAIHPPGAELAIIDENGEVIYHFDTQRMGYENFFAEADRNRELRSAVLARRRGHVAGTYWGEDVSMFVRPLEGSRWTLVTFRAKRLTRVMNIEAALLTLMLLLVSAGPYFLLYVIVLLRAPMYRAPSLWPDEQRRGDYLRLSIILLALLMLFVLNNSVLSPWLSLAGCLIIPLVAYVSVYLVLHRSGSPRRFNIATAIWIAINAVLISCIVGGGRDPELYANAHPAVAKTLLVTATLAVMALTLLLLSKHWGRAVTVRITGKLRSYVGYARLYRLCGVLLLAVGVTMPVVGFFRISRHVEAELLTKYGQLHGASDLERRIDRLETLSVRNVNSRSVDDDIFSEKLGVDFVVEPPRGAREETKEKACLRARTIPAGAATLLPALYEDSIAIRPLFEGGSDLWRWCREGALLKLVRKIHFDEDVSLKVWKTTENGIPKHQRIVVGPKMPQSSFGGWLPMAMMALLAIPVLAIFWYAVNFVATRVLLIDVREPSWLAREPLSPTHGDHIFLVRRDKQTGALTGADEFLDVSFAELERSAGWSAALETLDSSAVTRKVRVVDFEHGINDGAINAKKLDWLERLLALPDRTVLIVSTVSTAYIAISPPPPDAAASYFDRWRALLDRFVCVTVEEIELRREQRKRRRMLRTVSRMFAAGPKTWLEKETEYNLFLRDLRSELADHASDRTYLLDEIGERAETYYAGLWGSCREEEKLLLYQLAHNGLANGRNRRTLRRLIARGLVRRDPNLELFSETFRLYVLAAARREDLVSRAREQRGASTWDSLRIPFFVVIISFLLLLFATQKDLLTTTTALAAALTTGLPMVMKLIGVFTERRIDTSEKSS